MPTSSWLTIPCVPVPSARATLAVVLLLHTGLMGWWFGGEPIGASWREADTMAIATNQARDGFDLLHPRVDWRGDTSGDVECEFPLFSALVGAAAGDEGLAWPGRWLSLLASAVAVALWFLVLERRCGSWPAWFGAVALVCGGQYAATATRVIPDPASTMLGVAGLWTSLRFVRSPHAAWLVAATGLATAAMLTKPTSGQWLALAGAWTACAAPGVLRQPRVWLALLAALTILGAWLWHARQIGLETGLTFGVTFGDTKTPGLEHLLQPGLWLSALVTTLEFGAGPFGLLACGWLLASRRFDRSDAVVVCVVGLGILGSFRYSHSSMMGPQYHAVAAYAGSWWLARSLPARPGRLGGLLLVCLVALGIWHHRREHDRYGAERTDAIVTLGGELRALVPPDALLVVRSGKPRFDSFWRRTNNYEEPVLFWQSRRRGFVLPRDEVTTASLADVRARGGLWYVDRIAPGDDPEVAAWLAAHGTPRRTEPGLWVVELTK